MSCSQSCASQIPLSLCVLHNYGYGLGSDYCSNNEDLVLLIVNIGVSFNPAYSRATSNGRHTSREGVE